MAGEKADNWWLRHHPSVLAFKFKKGVKRAEKANAIDNYVTNTIDDIEHWSSLFETVPALFTDEARVEWIAKMEGLVVASDAFFPFPDNIGRVAESGVAAVAAPGGSVMDAEVVKACEKKGISMVFTEHRLFHH